MTKTQKLKTFEVVRTPKLRDATGAYCKRGETCQLTKDLAEHYHKLGFIRVQMETLFGDDEDTDGADRSPTAAQNDSRSDDPQPDLAAGTDDEDEAGEDASADAGAGQAETGRGRLALSRRKRAAG